METETWKPVPDFPGYEVSDLGRIRSWMHGGTGGVLKRPLVLKQLPQTDGRLRITPRRDGKTFMLPVHIAVLSAFVSPRPGGMLGCHNDDNYLNNRLDNLRWDTLASNLKDQRDHDLILRGERNGNAVLTTEQVISIRERYAAGEKSRDLAREFGVIRTHITDITAGRCWQHVGGPISHEPSCFVKSGRR